MNTKILRNCASLFIILSLLLWYLPGYGMAANIDIPTFQSIWVEKTTANAGDKIKVEVTAQTAGAPLESGIVTWLSPSDRNMMEVFLELNTATGKLSVRIAGVGTSLGFKWSNGRWLIDF